MGKLKTHSGAKKRFKRSATGKILARSTNRIHNFEHKSASRRRRLRKGLVIEGAFAKKLSTILP